MLHYGVLGWAGVGLDELGEGRVGCEHGCNPGDPARSTCLVLDDNRPPGQASSA